MSRLERIVAACGGVLLEGGRRALIPGLDHSRKDRSVSLREAEDGRILIYCFSPRDDWRAIKAHLDAQGLLNEEGRKSQVRQLAPARPPRAASAQRDARARLLWAESGPLADSLAEIYLQRRAIRSCAQGDSLRFHPRMTSLDDRRRRPALIAAILDPSGALQGLQATLLTTDGSTKASVATPRRVIGRMIGGAVRLNKAASSLIIAEGVETALSASRALDQPAWAALSAHNLSLFTPPPMVRTLIVALDPDPAGFAAFARLEARLAHKLEVKCAPPPPRFDDWNDWAIKS